MNQAVQSIDKPAALVSQAEKVSLPFDTSPITKEEFDHCVAETIGYIRSIVFKWKDALRVLGSSVDDAVNDMILHAYHIREKLAFDRVGHFLKDCQSREEGIRRSFLALMKTSIHRRMINHVRNLRGKNRTFAVVATDEARDKLERKIGRFLDPVDQVIHDELLGHPAVQKLQELQTEAETKYAHRRYTDSCPEKQRRELALHLKKAPGDLDRDPVPLARELGIDERLCARWLSWAKDRGLKTFFKGCGVKIESENQEKAQSQEGSEVSPVKKKPLSARQFLEGQRLRPGSIVDPDIVAAAVGCRRRTAMMAIRKAGHIVKGSRVTEPRESLQKPAKAARSRAKRPEPRIEEKAAPWLNFEAIRETVSAGWVIARGFLGRLGSMLTKPKAPAVPVKPRSRRPKSR